MNNFDGYQRSAEQKRLFRGETYLSNTNVPVVGSLPPLNGSGDITGDPAYPIPGKPPLLNGNGTFDIMPGRALMGNLTWYPMQNPDGYIYRDTLLYRSDLTPRRDGPNYRTLPASPTTPGDRYRFLDGRRGDVYG